MGQSCMIQVGLHLTSRKLKSGLAMTAEHMVCSRGVHVLLNRRKVKDELSWERFGDVGRGRLSVDAGKFRLRLNEVCWGRVR